MSTNGSASARPSLIVRARGFRHEGGHAIARLYAPGENVRGKASFARAVAEIHGGTATLEFHDLPPGPYALVVFHDENDNGEIDHRFGRPAEPLGFSGGFVLSLTSGLPTFERLKFEVPPSDGGAVVQEVTVR